MLLSHVAWLGCCLFLLFTLLGLGIGVSQGETEDRQRAEAERLKRAENAIVQECLARLGYGTGPFDGKLDEKTREAIRQYQANTGLTATGEVTDSLTTSLLRTSQALAPRVALPSGDVGVENWAMFAYAKGTWTSDAEKLAWPLQTTKIMCDRPTMKCTEITASIADGNMLWVDDTTYEVERWDEHELVTKPDDSARCVRYTMRFSRSLKAVTALRSTRRSDGSCEAIENKDIQLKLEDGTDVSIQLERERRKLLERVMRKPWIGNPPGWTDHEEATQVPTNP